MNKNKELHTRQELIVELYNHTMKQLCRGNIGDFKDGIAMINTLATLVTSPNFPATFTARDRDIGLLAGETIAICEKEDYIVELEDGLRARIAELEAENERLQDAWFRDETICPDGSLRPKASDLLTRILELEYNASNNAMSIHAIMNLLDINGEMHEFSDDMYDTTLDLAHKLRARIAELEEELRWIPVEEKLPEKYRDDETGELIPFLACTKKAKLPFRALYDGTQWGDGMFPVEVTHWKPLPKLPKECEK